MNIQKNEARPVHTRTCKSTHDLQLATTSDEVLKFIKLLIQ